MDVSPVNDTMIVSQLEPGGADRVEVWSLNPLHRKAATAWNPQGIEVLATAALWNPAGTRIAAGLMFGDERPLIRLGFLSPDLHQRTWNDIPRQDPPISTAPCFWSGDQVYAWTGRDLLACSPATNGCTEVYRSGKRKAIVGGVAIGPHEALVLVTGASSGPYETRANEIHRVHLEKHTGEIIFRTSDGALIHTIDWIDSSP